MLWTIICMHITLANANYLYTTAVYWLFVHSVFVNFDVSFIRMTLLGLRNHVIYTVLYCIILYYIIIPFTNMMYIDHSCILYVNLDVSFIRRTTVKLQNRYCIILYHIILFTNMYIDYLCILHVNLDVSFIRRATVKLRNRALDPCYTHYTML